MHRQHIPVVEVNRPDRATRRQPRFPRRDHRPLPVLGPAGLTVVESQQLELGARRGERVRSAVRTVSVRG